MARKKKEEDAPQGSPAWMATFSDLMNLLLCFFVLLFSMSTVDAEKFEQIAAALSNSFSVLPAGGAAMGEGALVSNGVAQLNDLAVYSTNMGEKTEKREEQADLQELEEEKLEQSENMAEEIEEKLEQSNVIEAVEIDFTSQYVVLTLNGTLLFDSGKAEIRQEAMGVVDSIGELLPGYAGNVIEIEGHTDNVPIHTARYRNNNELSSARAISVAEYYMQTRNLNPSTLKYSGRGEYVPIGDNNTAEGRAQNRRVEIKIYNELSSN